MKKALSLLLVLVMCFGFMSIASAEEALYERIDQKDGAGCDHGHGQLCGFGGQVDVQNDAASGLDFAKGSCGVEHVVKVILERLERFIGDVKHAKVPVVPKTQRYKQADGGKRRKGQGKNDLKIDAHVAGAIQL